MAFKRVKTKSSVPETPELLFNDLKMRAYEGMLPHQADVTRKYCNDSLSETDVALQLPTGSGKTLVGLLIGEWRRRKFEERILYVCPTNQLVHQVVNEAKIKYGLRVNAFTGKKSEYPSSAKREYRSSERIAVTNYSSLFNTSPYFTDPQVIILDDAHAAENYISKYWTLHISNLEEENRSLFAALASLLKPLISFDSYLKMVGEKEDPWTRGWVDKLPTPIFYGIIPELINTLDAHVVNTDLYYSWSVIGSSLKACHLYIAAHEISIRPLIPPTDTHLPFKNATQRIYMSATLGAGGDLERLTGKAKIKRLEVPSGWDTQGIGRRFFIFPALTDRENQKLSLSLMEKAGRSLVLVPNDHSAQNFSESIEKELDFKTFDARDIEITKESFVSSDKAVAIIANRYDGIDFPNDDCRLLVANGLPKTTNLQEKFVVSQMSAITLLNDRILTRVVQAIGRCTRSPTDYSAVLILGDELLNYLLAKDRKQYLHPELQAEIEFGSEQSKEASADEILDNLKLFLEHGDDWSDAEENIIELRSNMKQETLPGTEELREAVASEVKYQYCLWSDDFSGALEHCRKVLGNIESPSLRGYRALWNYLAGSAAFMGYMENGTNGYEAFSQNYFREASKAAPNVPWLNKLTSFHKEKNDQDFADDKTLAVVERMERVLDKLGVRHDGKFAEREKEILDGILSNDSKCFETAQVKLGELLGYESGNRETNGAPDPWWQVDETLCFIFEDHSGATESSSLHVDKARQAATHKNWVVDKIKSLKTDAMIISILVTPVKIADRDVLLHLKEVFYWELSEFRDWAKQALGTIREIRKTFSEPGELDWRSKALDQYKMHLLCPNALLKKLQKSPAVKILKSK